MKIGVMVVTYHRGGGWSPYKCIADLLMTRLDNYGSAVNTIDIYPRLALPRRSWPTSDVSFEKWQKDLEKLPYIAFQRKDNRFDIAFRSEHFTASDMDAWQATTERTGTLILEAIGIAGDEIKEAIRLIRKRIKPSDDFDVIRFLADVEVTFNSTPESIEEWNAVGKIADKERKAIHAAKSPWAQLEIDWSQFHHEARDVLDDPFYWDCVDDIAPHGNDTGADLLESYWRWDRRNSTTSPLVFLEKLLKKWGIEPIDSSVTNKDDVLKLDKERSIEMEICNEAAIALAFAVIKMRASCPAEVVDLAKRALERTSILVKSSTLSDEIKSEWDIRIKQMNVKLESSPQ